MALASQVVADLACLLPSMARLAARRIAPADPELEDHIVARGERLARSGERFPMTRLTRHGSEIRREDRWPTVRDIGSLVILPGGEVGTPLKWWNAEDESEWRWQVEFYNHQ